MAYTLEAFLAGPAAARVLAAGLGSPAVPLRQGVVLVPMPSPTHEDEAGGEGDAVPSVLRRRMTRLTASAERLAERASTEGAVAYVEAEYFGGAGEQQGVLWREGQPIVLGPTATGPINEALQALGVRRAVSEHAGELLDEFDTIGLGRHRATEDWLGPRDRGSADEA